MKKLAAIWLFMTLQGCSAIGQLQDAVKALDDAEKALDGLDISGCMDVCSDLAEVCLEEANGTCVDACEVDEDSCDLVQDDCFDDAKISCVDFEGLSYTDCIQAAREYCDQDCGGQTGDCIQVCGEEAQDCLVGGNDALDAEVPFATCMSDCIDEMEGVLQDIDL